MNNLDKQYNELIDEVYKKYSKQVIANNLHLIPAIDLPQTKEEFINKIKTDGEFAERWDVQINRRELTWEEQVQWVMKNTNVEWENLYIVEEISKHTTPKRAISLTYNNETIEIYE